LFFIETDAAWDVFNFCERLFFSLAASSERICVVNGQLVAGANIFLREYSWSNDY
jgi:hypothetical protein